MARSTTRRSNGEDAGRPAGRRSRGTRTGGRGRGARSSAQADPALREAVAATVAEAAAGGSEPKPPARRRGRPRKAQVKAGGEVEPAGAGARPPAGVIEPAGEPRSEVAGAGRSVRQATPERPSVSAKAVTAAAQPDTTDRRAHDVPVNRPAARPAGGDGEARGTAVPADLLAVSRQAQEEMAALVREQLADSTATAQRLMTCTSVPAAISIQVEAAVRAVARLVGHGHAMATLGRDMVKSFGVPRRGRR